MLKVILLTTLVGAAWTKGYPTVHYENNDDDGHIHEGTVSLHYGKPIYQTQVEYNEEDDDDHDLAVEDELGNVYDQKVVEVYPKFSSGYMGDISGQNNYKGSDISDEIKHKKHTYEETKVKQEEIEVKSINNNYGSRLPNLSKKETSPKRYKPSRHVPMYGKKYSDETDYSQNIGQSNKEPQQKHDYKPISQSEAKDNVYQQEDVDVDFKSQSPPAAVGKGKTSIKIPSEQTLIDTGTRPAHYGSQGAYMDHDNYKMKNAYKNFMPDSSPKHQSYNAPQTYGIYRERPTSRYPTFSSNSNHQSGSDSRSNLGKQHGPSTYGGESGSGYSHGSPHYNTHSSSEYKGPSSGPGGPRSGGNVLGHHNYGSGSGHGYSSKPAYSDFGKNNQKYGGIGSHVSPYGGGTSNGFGQANIKTKPNAGYGQASSGYGGHNSRNSNFHKPLSRNYGPVKSHGIKGFYPGSGGVSKGAYSGSPSHSGYHGSLPTGHIGGKVSHGSYHPKSSYPQPKINQEKHSDDYKDFPDYHAKGSPYKIGQEKLPESPSPRKYPSPSHKSGGIGDSSYHGIGETLPSYPKHHPAAVKSDYSPSYQSKPFESDIKGGSQASKLPSEYHGIGEFKSSTPSDKSHNVKGGSSYNPPKGYANKNYPKESGIKGGIGSGGSGYDDKKPQYLPVTAVQSSGSSYKPPITGSSTKNDSPKYDPPKYDSPKYDPPKYESPKYDQPKYDSPKHDSPKYDSPKYDTPKYDSPKYDPPKYDPPKYDSPKYDPPKYNPSPKYESSKYDPPKLEQKEESYEALLGGHGSQTPGSISGGYGFPSSENPSSGSGGPLYGSDDEHEMSKPMPYEFKYEVKDDEHGADQYREEKMDDNGYLTGRYGYKDAHGLYRQVEYQASKDGFKVSSIKTNEPGTENEDPADVHFEVENHNQPQY